jgi:hypothetical protein
VAGLGLEIIDREFALQCPGGDYALTCLAAEFGWNARDGKIHSTQPKKTKADVFASATEWRWRRLKHDLATGHMHHAHLLAGGVGHAFDGYRHGKRATGVEVLHMGRQQIAGEGISAFDSVLGTMGWLHDEDLAVVTGLMKATRQLR